MSKSFQGPLNVNSETRTKTCSNSMIDDYLSNGITSSGGRFNSVCRAKTRS